MSYYSYGTGHDVALVDMTLFSPQPRSLGVQPTRRVYTASGAVIEEGYYVELLWNVLPASKWNTLINALGLGGALYAEVTIRIPNHQFAYTRYNGTAVRPQIGSEVMRQGYFLRNVSILVRDMALAA